MARAVATVEARVVVKVAAAKAVRTVMRRARGWWRERESLAKARQKSEPESGFRTKQTKRKYRRCTGQDNFLRPGAPRRPPPELFKSLSRSKRQEVGE